MKPLALLLLLASCAAPGTPAERACRAQANDDPLVSSLIAKSAGSYQFAKEHEYDLAEARRQAQLRCLRARGIAPPGGVAAPVHENNLFRGLF